MRDADLVLVDGRIHTMDPEKPMAKGIAFGGGRILAVGANARVEGWTGKGTKLVDLDGKVVVPGFIDAHAHLMESAADVGNVRLGETQSIVAAIETLRSGATKAGPGGWVVGEDWDESRWAERRYLRAADLDRVSTKLPVVAIRVDRHMASANSVALQQAAVPPGTRGLELDAAGRPTGVLKEEAYAHLLGSLELAPDQLARNFPIVAERALSLGITTVHDVVGPLEMRAYHVARAYGGLRLRAYLMVRDPALPHLASAGLSRGFGDEWLRLGAIKAFSDGSLGARTAALLEPYADYPTEGGILVHPPKELRDLLTAIHGAGFQAAVHAIGDRAIQLVIETLEAVSPDGGGQRHRIEHAEILHPEQLDRMAAHGIVASCQPNFVGQWSLPGGLYEKRLGFERTAGNNPYKQILERGVTLAFGSDGMPYGPLEGIHWAVNAPFGVQRLTVDQAVAAYTLGSATAGFQESERGTLVPGKLGDAVVLDGDPWREPDRIRETRVAMAVVDGQVRHRGAGLK